MASDHHPDVWMSWLRAIHSHAGANRTAQPDIWKDSTRKVDRLIPQDDEFMPFQWIESDDGIQGFVD